MIIKIIKLIHKELIEYAYKKEIPIMSFYGLPYLICWCGVISGMIYALLKPKSLGG